MNEIGEGSVLWKWVEELPWKQQTVLLTAIRGCDGVENDDPSKEMVKSLRGLILKDADPDSGSDRFMNRAREENTVARFMEDLDKYPLHWLTHFIQAVEIVGYKYPEEHIRQEWNELYAKIVEEGLHLRMEHPKSLDERLSP